MLTVIKREIYRLRAKLGRKRIRRAMNRTIAGLHRLAAATRSAGIALSDFETKASLIHTTKGPKR